ncbi:DnaJ-domain-containing protein, partial [Rozella allomycis CSF55]
NIDHYDLLGVEKFASVDEIKTRYQKLVKKYHPDLAALNGNLSKEESHDRFIKIKQAYDDLINKERRKAYDSKIFSQGSMRREEDEIENSTPFAERMKNYKPPSYEEFERTILATATYHEAFAGEEEREGEHLSMIEILRTASITKRFGIIASVTLAFGVFVESM